MIERTRKVLERHPGTLAGIAARGRQLFNRNHARFLLLSPAIVLLILSCSEELPPYKEPSDVLQSEIQGRYVYDFTDNIMKVCITVKNTYRETFQSGNVLRGSLQIILSRDQNIRKTAPIDAANLIYARDYNSSTRVLTLDPRDSIILGYSWNFIDDNGTDLRKSVFQYSPDPTCTSREIAGEETFIIRGDLRVFSQTGSLILGSINFSFRHVKQWVDPKGGCLWIPTDRPCSK
jgi:hypothetical protein